MMVAASGNAHLNTPLLCRRVAPAVQASRVLDMKGNGLAHLLDFYCSFKVG
jgi:hypothetical protein